MSIDSPNEAPPASAIVTPPSRTAAWLPWVVVAVLTAMVVGTLVLTDNSATVAEPALPVTPSRRPIRAVDLRTYVFPADLGRCCSSRFVVRTAQRKTFSMPALLFLAGTTMFWIEWPADWGSYLVYNRDFLAVQRMDLNVVPDVLEAGWRHLRIRHLLRRRVRHPAQCGARESRGDCNAVLPKAAPTAVLDHCLHARVFYAVDILGERLMTLAGWYSYVEPVGSAWTSDRGSLSFVWPAIPFLLVRGVHHADASRGRRWKLSEREALSRPHPARRHDAGVRPTRRVDRDDERRDLHRTATHSW